MESLIQTIIAAVSWTFLHSLWQGFVLAIIGAAIIYTIPVHKSKLRHNLLTSSIAIFLLCNVITFFHYMQFSNEDSMVQTTAAYINSDISFPQTAIIDKTWINSAVSFIDHNTTSIFLLWLTIFMVKLLMFLNSLFFIYKMKNNSNTIHDKQFLNGIKSKLNISKVIRVYESNMVSVPSVTGIFKPILFLPLGFFNQMSAKEAEAVLLHELAHIQRSDYLINVIQSIVETIYFFNLPLLWVSNLLKEEREHCCDDIALRVHKDKDSFVQAILYWQSQSKQDNAISLGFLGGRMPLLSRINRILFNTNTPFKNMEKIFIGSCFLFTTIFGSTMYSIHCNDVKNVWSQAIQEHKLLTDTIDPVKVMLLDKQNNSTTKKKIEETLAKNNLTVEQYVAMDANKVLEVNTEIAEVISQVDYALSYSHELEMEMHETDMQKHEADMKQHEADMKQHEVDIKQHEAEMKQHEADMKKHEIEMKKHEADMKIHEIEMQQQEIGRQAILEILIAEGLITIGKRFTLHLTKDELIIDGKKQSEALLKKCLQNVGKVFKEMSMDGTYHNDNK